MTSHNHGERAMTRLGHTLHRHALCMTMAGVSGGDLKQRVLRIVGGAEAQKLTSSRTALIAIAAAAIVSMPIATGMLNLQQVNAQQTISQQADSHAESAAPSSSTAFETASIRPAHLTPGCFSSLPPGSTQYAVTCVTLRNLIELAYSTNYIDGGGSALDAYYDLRATTPNGKPWTTQSVQPMLRQFLAERFHLKLHTGQRELQGYSLLPAKGGPKLHAVAPEPEHGQEARAPSPDFVAPGHVQARRQTPAVIAGLLGMAVHAPVVDHTGLSGLFNVDLSYAPDNSTDTDLPSFFTAVEEQLGLVLKADKVTVATQVIDHVDSTPTPN